MTNPCVVSPGLVLQKATPIAGREIVYDRISHIFLGSSLMKLELEWSREMAYCRIFSEITAQQTETEQAIKLTGFKSHVG